MRWASRGLCPGTPNAVFWPSIEFTAGLILIGYCPSFATMSMSVINIFPLWYLKLLWLPAKKLLWVDFTPGSRVFVWAVSWHHHKTYSELGVFFVLKQVLTWFLGSFLRCFVDTGPGLQIDHIFYTFSTKQLWNTVKVRRLHTLRLESLKLVFQPLHKFIVNKL